jgi:hypothetical protein
MNEFTNFFAAIADMAPTKREQAAQLEMTPRRLQDWQNGDLPQLLRVLKKHPRLIDALRQDASENVSFAS